jgi:hypothetical protein
MKKLTSGEKYPEIWADIEAMEKENLAIQLLVAITFWIRMDYDRLALAAGSPDDPASIKVLMNKAMMRVRDCIGVGRWP